MLHSPFCNGVFIAPMLLPSPFVIRSNSTTCSAWGCLNKSWWGIAWLQLAGDVEALCIFTSLMFIALLHCMNFASPKDLAIMNQASKNNETLKNAYIWSGFYEPLSASAFVTRCHEASSFSCHQLSWRKETELWGSHMIIWFQQLSPINIISYHETQDVVRAVRTVRQVFICVTGQRSSAKTTSLHTYPWFFVGIKPSASSCLLPWTPHVEGGMKGTFLWY